MKVYIVMADTWNGEASVNYFDSVWASKESAEKYVKEMNEKRTSSYSTNYDVEYEAHEVRS